MITALAFILAMSASVLTYLSASVFTYCVLYFVEYKSLGYNFKEAFVEFTNENSKLDNYKLYVYIWPIGWISMFVSFLQYGIATFLWLLRKKCGVDEKPPKLKLCP